jgi:hypothetical protein
MKKKDLLLLVLFILSLLLSGCLNYDYAKFFPAPPSTDELLGEQQSGELANPISEQKPNFGGISFIP